MDKLIDLNAYPVSKNLKALLKDKTTKKNIIFATSVYSSKGIPIKETEQITEEILKGFSEVSSEYQIRISHLDGKDTMRIYVETNGTVDFLDLAKRIAATVKSRIGFTPLVKVVEIGLLPRSEKKTKRVIDERYE